MASAAWDELVVADPRIEGSRRAALVVVAGNDVKRVLPISGIRVQVCARDRHATGAFFAVADVAGGRGIGHFSKRVAGRH